MFWLMVKTEPVEIYRKLTKLSRALPIAYFFYVFVSLTMISEQNPNKNLIMRRAGLNTQLEIQCKFWERLRVPRHSWSYWLNPLLDLRLDLSGRSASWCHLTFLIWKPTHEILWPIIRSTISKWKNPQNHNCWRNTEHQLVLSCHITP